MASFGPRLKKEREQRGIGLDEIAQSTKIGTRFLHALEEEQFDHLPGGIFNKGFVRAYARHLGLDEEQAIADYLTASGVMPAEKKPGSAVQASAPEVWPEAESDGAASLPWGLFAVALLIVALGFAVWGFYAREVDKGKHLTAVSAKPHEEASPQSSSPTPLTSSTAGNDILASPAVRSQHESPATTPVSSATGGGSSAAAGSRDATPTVGSLIVRIIAHEDSWISITSDGREVMRGTLAGPGERTIQAKNQVVVRAGNVGALDFEFNGKKLPVQGDYDEVKTLTFDTTGLRPSIPKPEATQQP